MHRQDLSIIFVISCENIILKFQKIVRQICHHSGRIFTFQIITDDPIKPKREKEKKIK
jgi:hypothetical protein